MNIQKFVLGSFVGGIIKFFLGFIFVGVLLKDFFAENGGPVTNPDTMVWWALVLGNLFSGVLLVYFFIRANISTLKKGASPRKIVNAAKKFKLTITLENGKLKLPNDKKQCKDILTFLNEQYYIGLITGNKYRTNSKRSAE